MRHDPLRRRLMSLAGAAALAPLAPRLAAAREEPIELTWRDLVPEEHRGVMMEALQMMGIVQHGMLNSPWNQEAAVALTTEYDGKLVKMPGYIIPLDFESTGVTELLLVPYVGACIHVPPPPPNQLVFVRAAEPYQVAGLFEPVWVTGDFNASAAETELAEVGYIISEAGIEPYEF
ncbi:MAG: DUF3299 domain-containing protein [Pseudomonadota bacterium]